MSYSAAALRPPRPDPRRGAAQQARPAVLAARSRSRRSPRRAGLGVGRAGGARGRPHRLPGHHHDHQRGPAGARPRAGGGRGARRPGRRPRPPLPRSRRHLRQARVGRDDRGDRLARDRRLLRRVPTPAAPRWGDGVAGDRHRRRSLRTGQERERLRESVHLPWRVFAVGVVDPALGTASGRPRARLATSTSAPTTPKRCAAGGPTCTRTTPGCVRSASTTPSCACGTSTSATARPPSSNGRSASSMPASCAGPRPRTRRYA